MKSAKAKSNLNPLNWNYVSILTWPLFAAGRCVTNMLYHRKWKGLLINGVGLLCLSLSVDVTYVAASGWVPTVGGVKMGVTPVAFANGFTTPPTIFQDFTRLIPTSWIVNPMLYVYNQTLPEMFGVFDKAVYVSDFHLWSDPLFILAFVVAMGIKFLEIELLQYLMAGVNRKIANIEKENEITLPELRSNRPAAKEAHALAYWSGFGGYLYGPLLGTVIMYVIEFAIFIMGSPAAESISAIFFLTLVSVFGYEFFHFLSRQFEEDSSKKKSFA